MKIRNQNTLSASHDIRAARARAIQDFKAMQAEMMAQNALRPHHPRNVSAPPANPPLVSPTAGALSGNPADVFARAGVITVVEPTKAKVTFEGADTDFRNTLIMYKLDEKGTFKDVQAVFPNATSVEAGGWMQNGHSSAEIDLAAGDRVGFALLPNGFSNTQSRELLMRGEGRLELVDWRGQPANMLKDSPESVQLVHVDDAGKMRPISGEYGNKLLHSTGNASRGVHTNHGTRDFADQLVDAERGKMLLGFDDKLDGDGKNRNSMLASIDFGRTNAAAIAPGPIDERPNSFREMAGADRKASAGEIAETARMFDADGDGRLNATEWARFAPLLNLTADDRKHLDGPGGRGDIESLPALAKRADVNGDGEIGEQERLEMSRRLNGNNSNALRSFREAAGIDMKLNYKEFLASVQAFDKNGDGLDQEEWNRFAPVLGMKPADRQLFMDAAGKFDAEKLKAAFACADANGDGQLDTQEVTEMRRLLIEYLAAEDNTARAEAKEAAGTMFQSHHLPIAPLPALAGDAVRNWLLERFPGLTDK